MDLFQVKTGRKVLCDTIKSLNFALRVENLEKGIYQIILSWDRDIVRPQEKERFARQPELGTPKYYMSTTFWLDSKESNNYKLLFDSVYHQEQIQELLLTKNGGESIKMAVVSDGENNKLYNEYLTLLNYYKAKNRQQKDSLRQVATHFNDLKLFKDSAQINAFLAKDWLVNVKAALLQEEIMFMKNNISSEVIPHIYHILVNTKDDFEQYREVYNLFPLKIRRELAVWNKNN
ncbi:hypothetical protein J2X77_004048 [Sphingobacterium sp. 2149]|nr:hypothetical protein [Sphingobacterium sp. 2149]